VAALFLVAGFAPGDAVGAARLELSIAVDILAGEQGLAGDEASRGAKSSPDPNGTDLRLVFEETGHEKPGGMW